MALVAFLAELGVVWLIGAGASLGYQVYRGRRVVVAVHYAAIFGLFLLLVYFIVAVLTNVTGVR